MLTILAVLEGVALYAVACATLLTVSAQSPPTHAGNLIGVLEQGLVMAVCLTVGLYYNELYDARAVRRFRDFIARLPRSFAVALLLLVGVYFVVPGARVGPELFLATLLSLFAILLVIRTFSYLMLARRAWKQRVLILGTTDLARQTIDEIEARPGLGYEIVGVTESAQTPSSRPSVYPVFGSAEDIDEVISRTRPHRIIVALGERRGRLPVSRLIESRLEGIQVEEAGDVYERITGKLALEWLRPSSMIFSHDFVRSWLHQALARVSSFLAALVGIILSAPLAAVIALAIKIDSSGPILFVHERVGLRGRRFRMLKFRTMHPTADERSAWAADNAHRITRVGRWLRKFRLDELPQFLNILRGDMNLIGPRPHPAVHYPLFVEKIPHYALRTAVRPGVTGWAQIRFIYANNLQEEIEKMKYDLYYIKHRSLVLDLRILFDTLKIVLLGRGAGASATLHAATREGVHPEDRAA